MSLHIDAGKDEIAPTVLITGDPLRAKFFAESSLKNFKNYNRVRGMLGYTGNYKGKKVSIQGTGIGIPSTALYIHELVKEFSVSKIIRIGTCGALQPEIELGEIIAGSKAISDSAAVKRFSSGEIQHPSTELLQVVDEKSVSLAIPIRKGLVFSTDLFYDDNPNRYDAAQKQGVLGVDMETSILYAMGAHYGFQSISLLTVSDNICTGKVSSAEYRERQTQLMLRMALELI